MRGIRHFVVLLALAGAATVAAGSSIAAGKTIVVDDDLQQCKKANFTSIQAAVAAAQPGDKIRVCAGVYNEDVVIDKTLEVEGASKPGCRPTDVPSPTRDAIIQGPPAVDGAPKVTLAANRVIFERFVVQDNDSGAGVRTEPAFSGYVVSENALRDNVFGLDLNSDGVLRSTVDKNCFLNTTEGAIGILAVEALGNASIHHNSFIGNANATLFLGSVGIEFEHNTLVDDGPIFVASSSQFRIEHNESLRHVGPGILVSDTNVLKIAHNDLDEGTDTAIGVTGGDAELLIEHNDVRGGMGDGISLTGSLNAVVGHNRVLQKTGDGIVLSATNDSVVHRNRSDDNGLDGIRATGGSSNNRFLDNHMDGNAEHDAHDDDRPSNTWEKNKCETDSPPGTICD